MVKDVKDLEAFKSAYSLVLDIYKYIQIDGKFSSGRKIWSCFSSQAISLFNSYEPY